jgi:hypothetical protein
LQQDDDDVVAAPAILRNSDERLGRGLEITRSNQLTHLALIDIPGQTVGGKQDDVAGRDLRRSGAEAPAGKRWAMAEFFDTCVRWAFAGMYIRGAKRTQGLTSRAKAHGLR